MADLEVDAIHLVRLALQGRTDDVRLLSRMILKTVATRRPDLAGQAQSVARALAVTPARGVQRVLPVDSDSRLELLRREPLPELETVPTWPTAVALELEGVLRERSRVDELAEAGLNPTRSLLFVGPPGVGKTLAARWLAVHLQRPLLTLDLAAVMSSFLGRTGNNIRVVLDFARAEPSVLLLDEFDAIAKRRDDATELGELKRLVTVLLQAVDDWPATGLLVAASNHPDLLDPAVWRRFDRVVRFPTPSHGEIVTSIRSLLGNDGRLEGKIETLATLLDGESFAEVSRVAVAARRLSIVDDQPIEVALDMASAKLARSAGFTGRLRVAQSLMASGHSQREVAALTGLSRDTIRKHLGKDTRAPTSSVAERSDEEPDGPRS